MFSKQCHLKAKHTSVGSYIHSKYSYLQNGRRPKETGEQYYGDLHITSAIFNFQIKEHLFPEKDSVRREEKKNEMNHSGQVNNLIGCFGTYYFHSKKRIKKNIIYIIF